MTISRFTKSLLAALLLFFVNSAVALNPDLRFYQYGYIPLSETSHLDTGVLDVVQDKEGFLWIASTRGLLRFDGYDVVTYRTAQNPGLVSNQPTGLFVDSKGLLYVLSQGGMSRYDGSQFTAVITGTKIAAHIQAITEDNQGHLWLGSEHGLYEYDGRDILVHHAETVRQVRSLAWHDDQLYVGSTGVVYTLREGALNSIPLPRPLTSERVYDLEPHQGKLYGATHAGMFTLSDGAVSVIDTGPAAGLSIDLLLSDRDNNLWFGSDLHLGRFFPNGTVEIPGIEDESTGWVPQLTQLFEDSTGRHWHASRYFGIGSLTDTPVRHISYTEGLPSSDISAVTEGPSGKVYLATSMGISALTEDSVEVLLEEEFDRSSRIHTLVVDQQRRLWVGSSNGLRAFDLDAKSWVKTSDGAALNLPVNALAIAKGTQDALWVGTDLGLYLVMPNSRTSIKEAEGISIESLLYDNTGTLWLGTEHGLASFRNSEMQHHAADLANVTGKIVSMAQLPNGDMVAATATDGLLVRQDDEWLHFSEAQGLPPESLIDIEVHNDTLWMITSGGIFRTGVESLYGTTQALSVQPVITQMRYRGLHTDYCCRGANQYSSLVANGVLVASTDDGLITFDLDAADAIGELPRPYVKSVSIGDEEIELQPEKPIELDADHEHVSIHYSALDLARGTKIAFRYRLNGMGDQWIETGSARTVHFNGLPAGSFTFELQASAIPGLWSDKTVSLPILRHPGFKETATFKIGVWAVSVLGVLGVVWLRNASTRRRHRLLEEAISERTVKLHEINNELETRNTDLRQASETDALTGLTNRRYFDTRHSDPQLAYSLSEEGVLVMLDIDHFKNVNDTYGHAAGDEILRQFADVMRSVTRQSDLVARWGGEEFMMLCRCREGDANAMLDRLLTAIRDHRFTLPDGEILPVTSSLGAVRYPLWPDKPLADRLAILLEFADAALYAVKSNGRNGWALLKSGDSPSFDVAVHRVGPLLEKYIEQRHLSWHTNREGITPHMTEPLPATGTDRA
ncbi:MAG: diguanylate cyclase [Gammaproteobacteria bacterium]